MRRIYRKKEQEKNNNPFQPNQSNLFGLQPKLQVGKPNDKYEKEADRVADIVVNKNENMPFFAPASRQTIQNNGQEKISKKPLAESITPLIQKQEKEKEETVQKQLDENEEEKVQMQEDEEEEMIQAQPEEEEEEIQPKRIQMQEEEEEVQAKKIRKQEEEEVQASVADQVSGAVIEKGLNATKGTGSKIDGKTLQEMESGFGVNFSNINIHTDSQSAEMNKKLGAQAFTHGNDIYFNDGKYAPGSKKGKHLLAHELTHTIQQSASGVSTESQTIRRDISSPVKNYVKNPDTSKTVTFKEGDVTIVVKPDTTTDDEKMKNRAETTFSITDIKTPGYESSKGKITNVNPMTYPTITIQTIYGPEVSATSTSAYGRGTTEKDKKAGKTSLGFHEGSHGKDYITYLKSNPVPTFTGTTGMKVKEYKKAAKKYVKDWKKYRKAMDSYSENLTDCVGTKASFCPKS